MPCGKPWPNGNDADARTLIRYWHVLYRPFGGINAFRGRALHAMRADVERYIAGKTDC